MEFYLNNMLDIYGEQQRIHVNSDYKTTNNRTIYGVLVRPYSKYSALNIIIIIIVINIVYHI